MWEPWNSDTSYSRIYKARSYPVLNRWVNAKEITALHTPVFIKFVVMQNRMKVNNYLKFTPSNTDSILFILKYLQSKWLCRAELESNKLNSETILLTDICGLDGQSSRHDWKQVVSVNGFTQASTFPINYCLNKTQCLILKPQLYVYSYLIKYTARHTVIIIILPIHLCCISDFFIPIY